MVEKIDTQRLVLRPLRTSDAGPLTMHCSDERVARMTTLMPHPYPPGAAEAFIEGTLAGRRGEDVWAIDATPAGGEELIGVVGFRPDQGEIGYWVGVPYWNAGYATEAVVALAEYLLGRGDAANLVATVFADNIASAAVLVKAGFRETGTTDVFSVARNAPVTARIFRRDRIVAPGPAQGRD
ncbi:MAG TPA: GNAT family N-acetyltransferase [Thermohalobaculum sp.]|nr:GNAT family N-acetyltransferase [Thermohalobaculum sp.]